jgi:hypothetical protein
VIEAPRQALRLLRAPNEEFTGPRVCSHRSAALRPLERVAGGEPVREWQKDMIALAVLFAVILGLMTLAPIAASR